MKRTIAAAAIALVIVLTGCPTAPEVVAAPELFGLSQSDAAERIEALGLAVGRVTEQFSRSVAVGRIAAQFPGAGTPLVLGSGVDLLVSRGPGPVSVPDVVGSSRAAAEAALLWAGLRVGAVREAYDSAPVRSVISQSPAPASQATAGSAVELVLSRGAEPVSVPDVVGMMETDAASALWAAGLTVGDVSGRYSDEIAEGIVLSQGFPSGSSAGLGTLVNLVVSQGPRPVLVPAVANMPRESAETRLVLAGLIMGTVTEAFSDTAPAGSILSQDPLAGTRVLPGTAVNLIVSKGPEPVTVPNVIGLPESEASTALLLAGLTLGSVSETFHETASAGEILGQVPPPGTSVAPGSHVDLVVSLGPEPIPVPDFTAMSQSEAEDEILSLGLVVGLVTETYSVAVPVGEVISQEPSAGTIAFRGTPVDLLISLGPEPAVTPNLLGLNYHEALALLDSAGLIAGVVDSSVDDTETPGTIMTQDPQPGAITGVGFWVDIVLATGSNEVWVPNLLGMTQAEAEVALRDAGLTVGEITRPFSTQGPKGTVVSQASYPRKLAEGSPVSIALAEGPEPDQVAIAEETFILPGGVPLDMVWIPPGSFMMGPYLGELWVGDRLNRTPPKPVILTQGYWLGKYEVTKAQWEAVMGTTPWSGRDEVILDPDSPAVWIDRSDVEEFVLRLSELTGLGFRLPTGAEWEYACRAGSRTRFHWGDDHRADIARDYALYYSSQPQSRWFAHVVGERRPNPWGLYDITGNVLEFCLDQCMEVVPPVNPSCPIESGLVTGRGGSWAFDLVYARSALYISVLPSKKDSFLGLRIAR